MNKILTVCIAAYNVDQYLNQALESLCLPRMMEFLEVLIIDDGSIDNTSEIANYYCKEYPNTFKYIFKENGGHGSVINLGIKLSEGKYFKILDGDDWFDSGALEDLLTNLKDTDADLICLNQKNVYMETGKVEILTFKDIEYKKIYEFKDVCEKFFFNFGIARTCIKTTILKDNNITLNEKTYYVDMQYTVFQSIFLNTVIFYDAILYVYRLERDGQSVSLKGLIAHKKDHIFVINTLMLFFIKIEKDSSIHINVKRYIAKIIQHMIRQQYIFF